MPRIKFKDREWVKRWRAKSPEFFLKFQNTGLQFVALGSIMLLFPPLLPVSTALISGGTAMAGVAKLTKKDITAEEREKEVNELKKELELLKSKLN